MIIFETYIYIYTVYVFYVYIYVYRYVSYTYFQFIELTKQSFVSPNARISYDFPSRITGNSWPNQIQTHDMSFKFFK